MANTYNRINELLPPTHQLDAAYLDIIIKLGFSKTVQKHAALDRLEARLLQLDKKKGETTVREWEGTWASNLLQTPEFAGFRKPYGERNTQRRHLLVKQRKAPVG